MRFNYLEKNVTLYNVNGKKSVKGKIIRNRKTIKNNKNQKLSKGHKEKNNNTTKSLCGIIFVKLAYNTLECSS